MIGKTVSAIAGRTIARTIGGASSGPAGMVVGAALPLLLPRMATALGPVGMVAVAIGTLFFSRYMKRRAIRKAATAGYPPSSPAAVLGTSLPSR